MSERTTGIGYWQIRGRKVNMVPCRWPGCRKLRPDWPRTRRYCDEHTAEARRRGGKLRRL